MNRRKFVQYAGAGTAVTAIARALAPWPAMASGLDPSQYFGVDSVDNANATSCASPTSCASCSTLQSCVNNRFGGTFFWGRYFPAASGSCPGGLPCFGNAEATTLRNNGLHHIVPLQSPKQSRLTDTGTTGENEGHNDGNAVCQAITDLIQSTGPVTWSCAGTVYVFLDVQGDLSFAYWKG
jgi:hypothetical protein